MAENEKKESLGATILQGVVENVKSMGERVIKPSPLRQPGRVKLLVSIVNEKDDRKLTELLNESSIGLSFKFAGTGTAHSALLDYLGIGETEKAVVIAIIPENDEEAIIREIGKELSLYLVGKGISFTVPLSGVSEIVANGIAAEAKEKAAERKKMMKDAERKYDLIIAAMEANHLDEAMEAARAAGAAGGTMIRARSVENEKAEQFIGISLAKEQELLLILAKREQKLAIMQALSDKVGLKTEAGGVIFSLPVDRTAGIAVAEDDTERKESEKNA